MKGSWKYRGNNILVRNANVYWRFALQKVKEQERETSVRPQLYKVHRYISQHVGLLKVCRYVSRHVGVLRRLLKWT